MRWAVTRCDRILSSAAYTPAKKKKEEEEEDDPKTLSLVCNAEMSQQSF